MAATAVLKAEGWNIDDSEAVVSNNPEKIYEEWNVLRKRCPVAWVGLGDIQSFS
jgi:hypothetical protein